MFLRCHARIKDGKEHRYWSVVENRRCGRGKVVQRQVLYLGEINDTQHESWCRTIEVFDDNRGSIFCKPWSAIDSIDPGSEWRLHRQWFEQSAMGDLLDEDYLLVEKNALYRCLDGVLKHKEQLFGHCANAGRIFSVPASKCCSTI